MSFQDSQKISLLVRDNIFPEFILTWTFKGGMVMDSNESSPSKKQYHVMDALSGCTIAGSGSQIH